MVYCKRGLRVADFFGISKPEYAGAVGENQRNLRRKTLGRSLSSNSLSDIDKAESKGT